ncbi:hypothetical protein [Paenibacillus pseudetheri]|uniref:Uncharacterized protein n=1 Tax=Paenibacillus pseudetheri TaxID=2897682 RepID=A0ABM9BIQ5_9BACL|nr:hypothetical protein [Paenibacillus pseudetheri]CAH1058805.1 hypothetical protein PAECIP111894_04991 [Paenibacillus pseudetheri]
MSGYIQIGRELQNHWLRRDKDYWMVFCEMYFLARYAEKPEKRNIEGYEVTIHQKEFIFGRPAWSRRMDISEQRLKTLVRKLVDEGFIKQTQKHNKFTVYSFEYVPEINQQNNQQSNQQDFPEQPAEPLAPQGFEGDSNQQDFPNQPAEQPAQQPKKEEGIKEEGIKEECLKPIGGKKMPKISEAQVKKSRVDKVEFDDEVWLKQAEYEKLVNELGEEAVTWMIQTLSSYKVSNGKPYLSDYATFKKGGWVRERYADYLTKKKGGYKNKSQQATSNFKGMKKLFTGGVELGNNARTDGSPSIENPNSIPRLR